MRRALARADTSYCCAVDGYLFLADRRKDMIISDGANIYPAEVEAALCAHPGVADCVVIGLPHHDMGQLVHVIAQPRPGDGALPTEETLRDYMSTMLARYKRPRTYEFVSTNLRSDAGKVRRSAPIDERVSVAEGPQVSEQ